ncbi:MAG TPA: hypothetical protein VIJ43_01815, partial [Burkholderiales bacterium]
MAHKERLSELSERLSEPSERLTEVKEGLSEASEGAAEPGARLICASGELVEGGDGVRFEIEW